MKKKIIIAASIFLALIVLVFIFFAFRSNEKKLTKENDSLNETLKTESLSRQTYQALADSLQMELNKCQGIEEPMTVEDSLRMIKKALAEAQAKLTRKPTVRIPVRRTFSAPKVQDVPEYSFEKSTFLVSPEKKQRTETLEVKPNVRYDISSTQFSGISTGSYLTTIDDEGYLTYKISKKISPQAPRLNTVDGALFTENGQYWVYTDKTRVVSVAEINIETVIWTVYIGNKDYGTGSYPMFLPHENLKPLIVQVRGYDYGAITQENIDQMAKTNPQIGKSLIPNPADGHSATDQSFWNGWSFKTKIVAVKKTITTTQQ